MPGGRKIESAAEMSHKLPNHRKSKLQCEVLTSLLSLPAAAARVWMLAGQPARG